MRDAVRAVVAVFGVLLLIVGGGGLLRHGIGALHLGATVLGVVFLVAVALVPPGKPRPPLYEDW